MGNGLEEVREKMLCRGDGEVVGVGWFGGRGEYDPENEWVLVGVSTGFTTNGEVHIYNSDGSFVMKSTVGIGPNGFLYVEK